MVSIRMLPKDEVWRDEDMPHGEPSQESTSFDLNEETLAVASAFPQAQIEMVRASDINIDPQYQRPLSHRKLKVIIDNWDARSFGAILVSRRPNGTLWAYDGQHRRAAAIQKFGKDVEIPCLILDGLTPQEEARAFVDIQTKRGNPQALHRYRAELFSGNQRAVAVRRIVQKNGFDIALEGGRTHAADNRINAVYALERVYDMGGEDMLNRVLHIIAGAWEGNKDALRGQMIEGIWTFLNRYRDMVSTSRLIEKLAEVTPISLIRQSQQIRDTLNVSVTTGIGMAIQMRYNHRLMRNKLPAWDMVRSIANLREDSNV